MQITDLSSKYTVRKLSDGDIAQILKLCKPNEAFYRYCPPEPGEKEIRDDMTALPPHTKPEDKYYVGFFDGENLAAVMDLILHYPDEKSAFIGFFMLDIGLQGRGEGTAVISELAANLKKQGFTAIRLGWIEGNRQAENFWRKNGFTETGAKTAAGDYTIITAERSI